jgi:hypothetical protein
VDKHIYCDILEREFLGTIYEQGLDGEKVIFHHDNDPKCTSLHIREC